MLSTIDFDALTRILAEEQNLRQPIMRLPCEMLTEIFKCVAEDRRRARYGRTNGRDSLRWTAICRVCRAWRELGHQVLAEFYARDVCAMPKGLEDRLQLARRYPLFVWWADDAPDKCCPLQDIIRLIPIASRLYLIPKSTVDEPIISLPPMLPELESLVVMCRGGGMVAHLPLVSVAAPRLQAAAFHACHFDLPQSQLKFLAICYPRDVFGPPNHFGTPWYKSCNNIPMHIYLPSFPNLVALHLDNALCYRTAFGYAHARLLDGFVFQNLEQLEVRDHSLALAEFMPSLECPLLQNMHICVRDFYDGDNPNSLDDLLVWLTPVLAPVLSGDIGASFTTPEKICCYHVPGAEFTTRLTAFSVVDDRSVDSSSRWTRTADGPTWTVTVQGFLPLFPQGHHVLALLKASHRVVSANSLKVRRLRLRGPFLRTGLQTVYANHIVPPMSGPSGPSSLEELAEHLHSYEDVETLEVDDLALRSLCDVPLGPIYTPSLHFPRLHTFVLIGRSGFLGGPSCSKEAERVLQELFLRNSCSGFHIAHIYLPSDNTYRDVPCDCWPDDRIQRFGAYAKVEVPSTPIFGWLMPHYLAPAEGYPSMDFHCYSECPDGPVRTNVSTYVSRDAWRSVFASLYAELQKHAGTVHPAQRVHNGS